MSTPTQTPTLANTQSNLKKIETFIAEVKAKVAQVHNILDADLTGGKVTSEVKAVESAAAPVAKGLIADLHETSSAAVTDLQTVSKSLDSLISKVIVPTPTTATPAPTATQEPVPPVISPGGIRTVTGSPVVAKEPATKS